MPVVFGQPAILRSVSMALMFAFLVTFRLVCYHESCTKAATAGARA